LFRTLFTARAARLLEVLPQGIRVEIPHGQTLLEALLSQGIDFPHDCTVGSCGTCKARLLEGRIQALSEFAYTLSAQELAANYILPCQSKPQTSLVRIEATQPAAPASGRYSGCILSRSFLTGDIVNLRVELNRPIRYLAGQYLNIKSADCSRPRSYSFAEPPCADGSTQVTLFVRRVAGGTFTEALFAGSLDAASFECDGPHGSFNLRSGSGPLMCIAGGSGLAPLLSVLEDAARRGVARPCAFLFGARTSNDLYALDMIDGVATRWAAPFKFFPVLSHEAAGSAWMGARGLVTEHIQDALAWLSAAAPTNDTSAHLQLTPQGYLCGPPGMIDAGVESLTRHGIPLDSIFYDKFTDSSHTSRRD
jgi:p-cymene methyl-monooxygenase electron transfer component